MDLGTELNDLMADLHSREGVNASTDFAFHIVKSGRLNVKDWQRELFEFLAARVFPEFDPKNVVGMLAFSPSQKELRGVFFDNDNRVEASFFALGTSSHPDPKSIYSED